MSWHEESLFKWAMGGLTSLWLVVLGWLHVRINRVEDGCAKACEKAEEDCDKKLAGKVSKDQFDEFKEANGNYHRATHKRLDEIAKKLR